MPDVMCSVHDLHYSVLQCRATKEVCVYASLSLRVVSSIALLTGPRVLDCSFVL